MKTENIFLDIVKKLLGTSILINYTYYICSEIFDTIYDVSIP